MSFKDTKCGLSAIDRFIYSVFHNSNSFTLSSLGKVWSFVLVPLVKTEVSKNPTNYTEIV